MAAQTASSTHRVPTSPWHRLMVLLGLKNEPLVLLPEWAEEAEELPMRAADASEPSAVAAAPQGQAHPLPGRAGGARRSTPAAG